MSQTMCSLNQCWDLLTQTMLSFEQKTSDNSLELRNALSVLKENSFLLILNEWYFEIYRNFISDELVPQFWSSLPSHQSSKQSSNDSNIDSNSSHNLLFSAFNRLYLSSIKWINNEIMKILFECYYSFEEFLKFQVKMKSLLRSILLAEIPISFNQYLMKTYSLAFSVNQFQKNKNNSMNSSANDSIDMIEVNAKCKRCEQLNECFCQSISENFLRFNRQLNELGLIEVLSGDAITSVMHSCIEKHIYQSCKGNFEVSCICNLKKWIDNTVIDWVRFVYEESSIETNQSNLEERLTHFLYETYANCRMEQMFDIIIEFPESEPSLIDLRECLEKCANFRPKLIKTLKDSLETRLLHPGVSTSDILAAYISAIKALRVLDPTGVILQLVCEPVRKYLKSRDDTVRCIITALTDETSSELTPEFVKGNLQTGDEPNYNSDDENIAENWQQWVPDPIDAAQASGTSKSLRSSDIVSILVNIYESKDLFVEEYQRLLAQRLLTNFECNLEHERRNLELLTLRFGESDLHACEVMLKDVKESERINQRINSGEIEAHKFDKFPINSLILSAQFWPEKLGLPLIEDVSGLKLPPEVANGSDIYTKAFETIKGSRTLNWMSHLGLVQLELDFNGRKLNYSVPPIQATIIWHFQDKQSWTVNELSEVMSIPPSILRRRIALWQNKGILKETTTDKFVLIEDERIVSSHSANTNETIMNIENDFDDDLGNDKSSASVIDEREEKLTVYWSFVVNMLHNLNSLPLERIHTMLQMFAMQSTNSNELTTHELRHFLDSKVREQKLVYANGQYRLSDTSN